ncbi:MAG: paraquat-inducible protein A [Campylobacterota bacterium]|nr:paraquat-inducible protein A [Campylobacterota bacterium]
MMHYETDITLNKKLCLKCEWLNDSEDTICKQCEHKIYLRKPHSFTITLTYIIAALFFLIPANLLPMMIITSLGIDEGSTIMEGITYFIKHGEASIGIIIFLASIAVPVFKIAVLLLLLLISYFKLHAFAIFGVKLYRIIEFIGKWSLLDIFVVAIMIGMVQFQSLATVDAGGAAFAFSLVVILTMLATESFDPRLMFDIERRKRREH